MPITEQEANLQMEIQPYYASGDNWEDKATEPAAYHPYNVFNSRVNGTGTRWDSDSTGQYMILNLPCVAEIRDILILWFRGYERKYRFKLEVSGDKTTWTTVFDGYSNEKEFTGGQYDCHTFVDPTGIKLKGTLKAQFLKITNIDGGWNFAKTTRVTNHCSIHDIRVLGHPTNQVFAYAA